MKLNEKTRAELLSKSKSADIVKSYGTTRYGRRNIQHIYNPKSSLNKLDQNALWKSDSLSFFIPVQGETDNYTVQVLFEGILKDINQELKLNSYKLEYKVFYKAIIKAINRQDIYVSCTCADFKYRQAYWASKDRYNSGTPQIVPSKVTNPNDSKGAGCKHIMKVLADLDWALDLASCINNYTIYMQEKYPEKYQEIIFPAIYNMSYQDALNDGIIYDDVDELDDQIEDQDVDEISEISDDDEVEEINNDSEEVEEE